LIHLNATRPEFEVAKITIAREVDDARPFQEELSFYCPHRKNTPRVCHGAGVVRSVERAIVFPELILTSRLYAGIPLITGIAGLMLASLGKRFLEWNPQTALRLAIQSAFLLSLPFVQYVAEGFPKPRSKWLVRARLCAWTPVVPTFIAVFVAALQTFFWKGSSASTSFLLSQAAFLFSLPICHWAALTRFVPKEQRAFNSRLYTWIPLVPAGVAYVVAVMADGKSDLSVFFLQQAVLLSTLWIFQFLAQRRAYPTK